MAALTSAPGVSLSLSAFLTRVPTHVDAPCQYPGRCGATGLVESFPVLWQAEERPC